MLLAELSMRSIFPGIEAFGGVAARWIRPGLSAR